MLFINFLTKKAGITVDSFSTDISSVTLNLRSLDADTSTLLDTLVSTYQDRSTLSLDDTLSFRYARLFKSADQALTTTLNTVTIVPFLSASVLDSNYFEMVTDGSYIIIKKPGVYVFMAKASAYLTGAANKTTSLQWSFQFDSTRSGLFTNVSNCNSYTYHVTSGNMYDSTVVCCTYNVTSTLGGYLRLVCKQVTGGANLSVMNDCTSLQIFSASGLSMYEGTLTTTKPLTTSFSDILLGSDRLIFTPLTHAVGQSTVTVNRSGTVYVICKTTFYKTSGTDASIGVSSILYNGSNPASNNYAYSSTLYSTGDKATVVNDCTIDVVAGDVISCQAAISTGTYLSLSASESAVMVFYLTSVNNENNLYTGDIAITVPPVTPIVPTNTGMTDIQFQTQSESFPNYSLGITFSNQSPQLIVNTTGMYLVTANICFLNPNGVSRTVAVGITESTDNGSTYIFQPGTTTVKRLSTVVNSYATVDIQHMLFLVVGNRIKLQTYLIDGTATDNIQVVNYTNLTAQCLQSTDSVVDVDNSLFGQGATFVKSYDSLQVSSTSWVEKCRLVTNYVTSGTYRVSLVTNFSFPNNTDTFNVQVVDFCTGVASTTKVVASRTIDPSMSQFTLILHLFLLDGVHNIVLELSSVKGSTLKVYNTVMEFWRFS